MRWRLACRKRIRHGEHRLVQIKLFLTPPFWAQSYVNNQARGWSGHSATWQYRGAAGARPRNLGRGYWGRQQVTREDFYIGNHLWVKFDQNRRTQNSSSFQKIPTGRVLRLKPKALRSYSGINSCTRPRKNWAIGAKMRRGPEKNFSGKRSRDFRKSPKYTMVDPLRMALTLERGGQAANGGYRWVRTDMGNPRSTVEFARPHYPKRGGSQKPRWRFQKRGHGPPHKTRGCAMQTSAIGAGIPGGYV